MNQDSRKRERKLEVLEAGERILRSTEYEWSKAVTFDRLELDTGIDRRQIERDFGSKQDLISELVSHTFAYDARTSARASYEQLFALADDTSRSFRDALVEIGRLVHLANLDDPKLLTQMALVGFAHEDDVIRTSLSKLYQSWDHGTSLLVYRLFERVHKHGVSMRDGLSVREFVILAGALSDGLALRAKLDPQLVPDDLVGRTLAAVVAAWLSFDDEERPLGHELESLDERRRSGGSTPPD